MSGRFWRQRRRLCLSAVLCFVTGALYSIWAAVLCGLVGAAITGLVIRWTPTWRAFVLKCAWISGCIGSVHSVAGDTLAPAHLAIAAAIAGVLLPSQLWWLDRVRLPFISRARVEIPIALDPDQVWAKLCPQETNDHWDPAIRGVRAGSKGDMFFLVYEALDHTGELQVPVKLFDVEPKTHFKTRDLSQPNAQRGGPVTVTSTTIEAAGAGSLVTLMEATWRQGMWSAFSMWLDDYLGDHADRMSALIEGRKDHSVKGAMFDLVDGS